MESQPTKMHFARQRQLCKLVRSVHGSSEHFFRRKKMTGSRSSGRNFMRTLIIGLAFITLVPSLSFAEAIIVDHTTTDLSQVPEYWIEQVKKNIKIYFGHTSHGRQLIHGLKKIEDTNGSKYRVAVGTSLPGDSDALCIYDRGDTYNPGDFFPAVPGILNNHPKINVVMYGWCGQPGGKDSQSLLKSYIDIMENLERQYAGVTFVYMTGHAQENDCSGCTRHRFNEMLRGHCKQKNKVLFDFGDLDVWYRGKMSTYNSPNWCACAGQSIPREHPRWGGGNWKNPWGHTTIENCEQKARAVWWMLARIRGWNSLDRPKVNQEDKQD